MYKRQQFNTPQVSQAFRFLRGLYDDGCAWLSDEQTPESDFAARRALFASGSLDSIPDVAGAMDLAANSDPWSVLPFPSPQGQPAIDVYGPDYVVLARQPAKALGAWLVIAPFALGYTALVAAFWNDIIAGIVVVVLAGWAALAMVHYHPATQ